MSNMLTRLRPSAKKLPPETMPQAEKQALLEAAFAADPPAAPAGRAALPAPGLDGGDGDTWPPAFWPLHL